MIDLKSIIIGEKSQFFFFIISDEIFMKEFQTRL